MSKFPFKTAAQSSQRAVATVIGSAPTSSAATQRWRHPTVAGMKDLASDYGKTSLALSGLFGATAMVSPIAAASVGSVLAAAHVVDLAANKDLDDLTTLPSFLWNRSCGPTSERKRVVVLGSGWGALSMARKLDPMIFDVTFISPRNHFFYTPLLAGVTTGTVKAHSVLEAVRQTSPFPFARYLKAECTGVDAEARLLRCADQETLLDVPYDHLVVAVGAQPNTFGIEGVQEHAMFLKELPHALAVRTKILQRLEQATIAFWAGRHDDVSRLLSVAIVGGGPTGVEFAAELADFINTDVKKAFPKVQDKLKVSLIEALPGLLPMFSQSIGEHVKKHLNTVSVDVLTETMVKKVDGRTITLAKKNSDEIETLDYGVLVWVAGIGARPITKTLAAAFGQSNPRGLEVDAHLRVKGAKGDEVFALGDCAVSGNALTAQVAAQQGKYLARAFRDEDGSAALPFEYDHQGTMAYVGKSEAVAVLQAPPLGGANPLKDFAFWRQLASCPDGWLKTEHRTSVPAEDVVEKKSPWIISVTGVAGFAIWRGVYFTKLFSYSNRFNVAVDWTRNFFFGRVVASSLQDTK